MWHNSPINGIYDISLRRPLRADYVRERHLFQKDVPPTSAVLKPLRSDASWRVGEAEARNVTSPARFRPVHGVQGGLFDSGEGVHLQLAIDLRD